MKLVEMLKEIFNDQAKNIKNSLQNNKEEIIKYVDDKQSTIVDQINQSINKIKTRIDDLQTKTSNSDQDKVNEDKFKEIDSKLNELEDIKKNQEEILNQYNQEIKAQKENIDQLKSLMGLNEIDFSKIKDAKKIDDVLKTPNLRISNPTIYDFLSSNFDKLKTIKNI